MLRSNARTVAEKVGNTLRLTVLGEIDHHEAAALREAMDDAILSAAPTTVEIDLSKVDFMDSSGLGILMGRKAIADRVGATVTLLNPSPRVAAILELSGLQKVLPIEYRPQTQRSI